MNIRKFLLFSIVGLRGQPLGKYYKQYLNDYQAGISIETSQRSLIKLFQHCEQNVPYYSRIMKTIGRSFYEEPIEYLKHFPILTKDIIRDQFDELKSSDLVRRKWYLNSSGGSTGEPIQLIQDWAYASQSGAIALLFSKLVGKDICEPEIRLWGNIHDIVSNTEGWRAQLMNMLENATFVNSQMMTPERIRSYVNVLNLKRAKLIVAYANSIYEIAKFIEREGLYVRPQSAIITSAFQLYPFMRTKIEKVFRCKVFDRYGSREVGAIACERPGFDGLWVAPWGNYLEIVDLEGNQVPDGVDGEILVTSLTNHAMPLVRYKIGDRGRLAIPPSDQSNGIQVLTEITGRSIDFFRTQDGGLVNPGFFMANLYFRDWIARYQVIQQDCSRVVYRVVKVTDPPTAELEEIAAITKKVMGNFCNVSFEFVDDVPPSPSGKFRFLISEIN